MPTNLAAQCGNCDSAPSFPESFLQLLADPSFAPPADAGAPRALEKNTTPSSMKPEPWGTSYRPEEQQAGAALELPKLSDLPKIFAPFPLAAASPVTPSNPSGAHNSTTPGVLHSFPSVLVLPWSREEHHGERVVVPGTPRGRDNVQRSSQVVTIQQLRAERERDTCMLPEPDDLPRVPQPAAA